MVDQILISIVAKIAEYTVAPVGRWLCYSFHYNSNIKNLNDQKEKLQHAKTRVEHSVDDALRNNIGHKIEDDVKAWLTKVDHIIELATRKFGEIEVEAGTRSSIATCLNLKKRHQLSQEAKKLEENIAELLKNGKFDKFSFRPALDEMVTTRDMDYMAMESRMTAVKAIMEALGSDDINKIGVWGMAGVGKSSLMREIARQATEDFNKVVNKVVMVVVTHSPDVKRIQGEIADMLGLKFDQETEKGRASLLQQELSKGKKILVILDDIWKELDLQQIGIPSEGCKLVMTSRDRDVLICGMATQKEIELKILQEEEAWNLFETMAGDSLRNPEVRDRATEIAKKCAGLPIALVTVSKALKNKSLGEWKDALRRLKCPASQHDAGVLKTVYSPLELSYNMLESRELKSLFLLCSQLSYFLCYRDLLIYSYGYGLLEGINTLEEARDMLDRLLRQLKDSSLLLESSNGFHLHDLFRDVAAKIASKDHNMFVMRDEGGQKAWPDVDSLKRCAAFSILGGDIDQLPNKMECPELRFFYIRYQDQSLEIPVTLFQGMDKLQVLDLNEMQLSSLPSSLLLLGNLQALCLDECELEDISGIGELKNLVILSLRHSEISELPREVGSLVRLRMLDLSNCSELKMIPPNVLSSLVKLEELYMGDSFAEWEADQGLNDEREYANLAELNQMSLLTTLEIAIPNTNNLPKASLFEKLKRYKICIGDDDRVWDWDDSAQFSRTLKLKLKTSFQLEVWIKMLLNRTEDLHLDELNGVKSVIPEMDGEGFQQLKHLHIQNNSEIKHIVNLRSSVLAFPILEKFVVQYMKNLEEIFCGKLSPASFKNLRVLKVEKCEKLRFVFSSSIAKELSLLEELKVTSCHKMVAIVVTEEEEEEDGIKDGDMILFCKLKKLVLGNLPELVSFLSTKNPFMTDCGEIITEGNHDVHMTLLHHQVVAFPSLEILSIDGLPKIKHVWTECSETNCRFQNLQEIRVYDCKSLRSVFTSSVITCLKQLKTLKIMNCGVEEIVSVEGEGGEAVARFVFPRVTNLTLVYLPRLKWFYEGVHISNWPMLEEMRIEACDKVEIIASGVVSFQETAEEKGSEMSIKQPLFLVDHDKLCFPSLKSLHIESMEKLEIIWQDQVATSSFSNIQTLRIFNCGKLLHVFQSNLLTTTSMQSLIYLYVRFCDSLETIFGKLEDPNGNETPESSTKERVVKEDGAIRHFVSTVASPSLEKREDLPKKNHRSKDPNTIFKFQNLQTIMVFSCENLKSVFTSSVITCIKQLKTLRIEKCGGVEEIVSVEGEGGEAVAKFVFPRVTTLSLVSLRRLKWFYKGVHVSNWPMLVEMKITRCDKVEIIASGVVSFQETAEEKGSEMSIKQPLFLVDHDKLPFPSLKTLHIEEMDKLEIICQYQVASMSLISNLQILRISGCQQLRLPPIFGTFIQNLTELDLEYPQSLETISGKHEGQKGKETQGLQSAFPNLEVLSLQFNIEAIWPSKFSDFPPSFLTRMPKLLDLFVSNGGWEEIFPYELLDREIHVMILTRLRRLLLNRLPMLTHLWKEDTQPCPLFLNLEFLYLLECSKLRNLVPSSVFLQNLTVLRISNCHGLINLVTSSTARSLTQLEEMSVTECKRITEIVAVEGGEANHVAITFNKLEYLELDGLPNLTNFCSGAYLYKFPSLEKVIVRCCPEMKTFCQYGVLETPKLKGVRDATFQKDPYRKLDLNIAPRWLIWESLRLYQYRLDNIHRDEHDLHWEHDLNTTIYQLWGADSDTRLLFRQSVENTEEDENSEEDEEDPWRGWMVENAEEDEDP